MKNNVVIFIMAVSACVLTPGFLQSAEVINGKTQLSKVELFQNGAQVYKEVTFTPAEKLTVLKVTDIPSHIDPSTVRAKAMGDQKIVSIRFETDYSQTKEEQRSALLLRDSIETLALEIAIKASEIEAIRAQESLLYNNVNIISEGHASGELEKVLGINKRELAVIKQELVVQTHKMELLKEKKSRMERKYERLGSIHKPLAGIIVMELLAKPGMLNRIEISYLVADAWWTPVYDIRVENTFKPLQLEYRAEVFQNSGEDWTDVDLVLFSNNPQLQGTLGELRNWELYFGSVAPVYTTREESLLPPSMIMGNYGTLKGVVTDAASGEPLPFVNVQVKQNGNWVAGTQTDLEGAYVIYSINPGFYQIEISSVGYTSMYMKDVRVTNGQATHYSSAMNRSAMELETVQVIAYNQAEAYSNVDAVYSYAPMAGEQIMRMPASSSEAISVEKSLFNMRGSRSDVAELQMQAQTAGSFTLEENNREELRVEFQAPGKQSIPSSDMVRVVYLKSEEVSASYVYRVIPKIDTRVYLYAEVPEWESLNLMSGKVNLFYSNTYVGETRIEAESTEDTMNISLGPDRHITVSRERLKEEFNTPAIGSSSLSTGWKIDVKSQKDYPIKVRVEDQVPVSKQDGIEVAVLESGEAEFEEKSGRLTWEIDLAARANTSRVFRYEVKYPKGTQVYLE